MLYEVITYLHLLADSSTQRRDCIVGLKGAVKRDGRKNSRRSVRHHRHVAREDEPSPFLGKLGPARLPELPPEAGEPVQGGGEAVRDAARQTREKSHARKAVYASAARSHGQGGESCVVE